MRSLIPIFTRMASRHWSYWLTLVLCFLAIGGFSRLSYQNFLHLQAQNIDRLSVFNEVLLPLAGIVILMLILMSIVSVCLILPQLELKGHSFLVIHSPLTSSRLIGELLLASLRLSLWPLVYAALIFLIIFWHSEIDSWRLTIMCLGILLCWLASILIVIAVCSKPRGSIFTMLIALSILAFILAIELGASFSYPEVNFRGIFIPFLRLREGVLKYADLLGYGGWFILLFSIACLRLNYWRLRPVRSSWLFSFAGTLVILAAVWLPGKVDITKDQRNTFSSELVYKLNSLAEDCNLVAVVDTDIARQEVARGFELLKGFLPNASLAFKNRQSLGPNYAQSGEFIQFSVGKQTQLVAYPFAVDVKTAFEQALDTLLSRREQTVTFLEGHEEASPFGKSTSDVTQFYTDLKSAGWPVIVQGLTGRALDQTTHLLVVASGKQPWLPGEDAKVIRYLEAGGNMLLLLDPDSLIPETIERYIGLERAKGTLVDWQGYQSGTPHPAILIARQFEEHATTANLKQLLAFPWTMGFELSPELSSGFQSQAIVKTHAGVWNETKIEEESLAQQTEQGELVQSFNVAMSLERELEKGKKQKIIVVGDSHFLSDSAINNYANRQFALNLISWLTNSAILNENRYQSDRYFAPSRWGHWMMLWGFSFIMPLSLMLILGGSILREQMTKRYSE
ncbi:hypothetical protein [Aliikangiella sp. G2MR2-5]|uniref:Gldg family protein n=1 Tax=Aliikangiella sp. G2MR2-5 TaxID=2788943 RepID=UPI0018AA9F4D|nr:hypothetical protein [Aliikangiella sp. G2MR2-5]